MIYMLPFVFAFSCTNSSNLEVEILFFSSSSSFGVERESMCIISAFAVSESNQLVQMFIETGLAFVDCSASSETVGVLSRVVDFGCCVVLANKKPLTSSMVTNAFSCFERYNC